MAYTVLARRYRSQSFGDVVGQAAIANTLINAIRTSRVAHAYLFCGTRGVGKTSMARIFARALNAPATVPDTPDIEGDDYAYPEEDVQQRMADAIMRGDDLNVIEIDGASNNSVADARDLIGSAGLAPTANARYKIYIIDEVHMLSTAAFNALLKTMEEPPSHVKFILATTEPHKIPATIHSRCQRFDFKNIPAGEIKAHLADVLKSEKTEADDEVLYQLAVLGNGSMRDALSLMDRLLATGETPLTPTILEDMLGLPARERVVSLVDAFADGDVTASLKQIDELLATGIGQDQLVEVLIEHLRQLMLIAACGADSDLIELSPDSRDRVAKQAARFDAPGLVHMIALCDGLARNGKSSSNPRALLDAVGVRLALAEKMADVTEVLAGGLVPSGVATPEKKKLAGDATAAPVNKPNLAVGASDQPEVEPVAAAISLDSPAEVWSQLIQRVGSISAFAWVDKVELVELDAASGVCKVRPRKGHREIAGFVNARQCDRLAAELTKLAAKRCRIELIDAAAPQRAQDTPDTASGSSGAGQRRKALDLPLVKDVFDVFPEAVLLDARAEHDKTDKPEET
ncbi:MAG: DNA polymerase III subunit gamma/tau [Phycisphaeraceae bacterium]|nr:DNA polymerase III subunit gamma/tau [Phycisphaeraceae bacterium]